MGGERSRVQGLTPRCSEMPEVWLRTTPPAAAFPCAVNPSPWFLCPVTVSRYRSRRPSVRPSITLLPIAWSADQQHWKLGNLLEIQIQHFNKNPSLCLYISQFEKHWSSERLFFFFSSVLTSVLSGPGFWYFSIKLSREVHSPSIKTQQAWPRGLGCHDTKHAFPGSRNCRWGICQEGNDWHQ